MIEVSSSSSWTETTVGFSSTSNLPPPPCAPPPPLTPPLTPTQEATDPVSKSCITDALIRFGSSPRLSPSSVHPHARLLLLLCPDQSPRPGCLMLNIPPGGAAYVYCFTSCLRWLRKINSINSGNQLSPQLLKMKQTERFSWRRYWWTDRFQLCCCLVWNRSLSCHVAANFLFS